MSMGDLRSRAGGLRPGTPASGSFRGTRSGRMLIELHSHTLPVAVDISLGVVGFTTDKSLDGRPGTVTLELRAGGLPGQKPMPWAELVHDDDWIAVGWFDGARRWLIQLCMVDRLSVDIQSSGGARIESWTIQARDLTKPIAETDLILMPWLKFDPLLGLNAFTAAIGRLTSLTPTDIMERIFDFFFRPVDRPEEAFWRIPDSISRSFGLAPDPALVRQFSDIIDRRFAPTAGSFGSLQTLLTMPMGGGNAWDMLKAHSNETLNELWVDLVPLSPPSDTSSSVEAQAAAAGASSPIAGSAARPSPAWGVRPALILRERPFPSTPGTIPHRNGKDDPWSELPQTILDAEDLTADLTRGGDERYNFFLVEAGSGDFFSKLASASIAAGKPMADFPVIDRESISIHGLKKLQASTNFVNFDQGKAELYMAWSKLYRDWYCLNPAFWSGTITCAFLLPGVRVGERVTVRGLMGDAMQFYVEGVRHQHSADDLTQRTTLTVTRGHPDPIRGLADYIARTTSTPSSPMESSGAAASRAAQAQATTAAQGAEATRQNDPVSGAGNQAVGGQTSTGDPVTIPPAED